MAIINKKYIKPKSLNDLLTTALATGIYNNYKKNSIMWLRSSASYLKTATPLEFLKEAGRQDTEMKAKFVNQVLMGNLYFYHYDPKLKKKLPYYDSYPIVFPIERYEDGFLGINLHYLQPKMRAVLMDSLYTRLSDKNYNYNTRLKISYEILKGASRHRFFKPCIKRYLYSHVVSGRYLRINPKNWELGLFLPLARFRKADQERVWADSRKIINKGR